MDTAMTNLSEIMKNLHEAPAQELLDRVNGGQATASDLSVVRQFLKDNGIDSVPKRATPLSASATPCHSPRQMTRKPQTRFLLALDLDWSPYDMSAPRVGVEELKTDLHFPALALFTAELHSPRAGVPSLVRSYIPRKELTNTATALALHNDQHVVPSRFF